jgi:hypothetical protein
MLPVFTLGEMEFLIYSILFIFSTGVILYFILDLVAAAVDRSSYYRIKKDGTQVVRWKPNIDAESITICFCIICAILAVVIGIIAISKTPDNLSEYDYSDDVVDTLEIYTLNDELGVTGRFTLGSGIIGNTGVYQYYYYEDGGYFLDNVSSKGVKLILNDNETPRIETITTTYHWSWFIFEYRTTVVSRIIYIPSDSIVERYLDQ